MDTVDLQYILDHSGILRKLNGQVCAKDLLPIHRPANVKAYIVNTHNAKRPGEHWVAIFFYDNDTAVYFDSYGLPPYHNHILEFLDKNSKRWTMNTTLLQGLFSMMCGVYCIYALHYLALGYPLDVLIDHRFNQKLQSADANDKIVGLWFKKTYGTLYNEAQSLPKEGQCCQCCMPSQGGKQEALYLFRLYVLLR